MRSHSHRYRIVIAGRLGEAFREAFADFRIGPDGTDTALIGELDHAGLHGALHRVQPLGLELVEVSRLASDARRGGPPDW
jgi:hypothetical protein